MAKKTTKSAARKPAKSSKPAAPKIPGNPKRISSGSGATPEDLGKQLVSAYNRGKWDVTDKLWSPKIISIEGAGMAWHGKANVLAKNNGWYKTNIVRGALAEGPYVGSTGFAVKFRVDVEDKSTKRRTIMEEVGVYTVKNGKIVQEEFMYGSMLPAEAAAPADHRA